MRRRPPRSPLLPYTTLCRSLEPMVRAAQRELRRVEVGDPNVVLADAGYWHQRQIEAIVSDGIQVLVSPDSSLRRGPRPGWTGGLYDFMRRVLSSADGRALYRRQIGRAHV